MKRLTVTMFDDADPALVAIAVERVANQIRKGFTAGTDPVWILEGEGIED